MKGSIHMKKIALLGCALLLLAGIPAFATGFPGGVCPPLNLGHNPVDCNVQVTANPGGSMTVAIVDPIPYELFDDMQVGFFNNTSSTILAISLFGTATANGGIFAYDGDDSNYDPSNISTTNIQYDMYGNAVAGTINFAGGIAPGGTDWFDLEEAPNNGSIAGYVGVIPEPNTLLLLGTGLIGLAGMIKRKLCA